MLTAAALLVAVVGLPIALYQLVALDRDIARPHDLIQALNQFRIEASPWVQLFYAHANTQGGYLAVAPKVREFEAWIERVALFIRENMDEAEVQSFLNAGVPKQPVHVLEDKLSYIRDQLIPKVREGYW